jgi:hypothetical protein
MALAQICACGHTKTDHATIMRTGKPKRTQCGWYSCDCNNFILKEMKSINKGFVTLPTLIDCNEHNGKPRKKYKSKLPYVLSDCDSRGNARDKIGHYHHGVFNNGEYP